MDKVFEALSSQTRRKILAYLSATSLTAGEIADRFPVAKPTISKHLSILESAGLISSERKEQFIHYSLVRDNLMNTLNGFIQQVCPVSRPLRRESQARAKARGEAKAAPDLGKERSHRWPFHLLVTILSQPERPLPGTFFSRAEY